VDLLEDSSGEVRNRNRGLFSNNNSIYKDRHQSQYNSLGG
jgi:hypothetical protein